MNRHDSRETVKNRVNKIYSLPPSMTLNYFLSQFLKGFNFAFPSIIWIKPIAFGSSDLRAFSTIAWQFSICIARFNILFSHAKPSATSICVCWIKFSKSSLPNRYIKTFMVSPVISGSFAISMNVSWKAINHLSVSLGR